MIRSALRVSGMPARRERRTFGPVYLNLDPSSPSFDLGSRILDLGFSIFDQLAR